MAVAEQKADGSGIRNPSPGTGQTEDAPLLLDVDQNATTGAAEQEPTWTLDEAFDGLPWWRKPSVSSPIPILTYQHIERV